MLSLYIQAAIIKRQAANLILSEIVTLDIVFILFREMIHIGSIFARKSLNKVLMENHYYHSKDLEKFGDIADFQKNPGDYFFSYYNEVFKDSELTTREKSLKCWSESQIMDAGQVASAIRSGASLVHSVQMMNKIKKLGCR